MALTEIQYNEIRAHLDNCKNPLFFFDDDQDGLCSFLLLYRYKREGHGIIVKTAPRLGPNFLKKVEEYSPDKVIILDLAKVQQDFLDGLKAPPLWIDHHGPFKKEKVIYYNPRVSNKEDNHPTSMLCYNVVKQDLWIATLGTVADWVIPEYLKDFRREYPDLVDKDYTHPGDIIFNTKLGKLIRIFSFILKGSYSEVKKSLKILTRIDSPYEILNQETSQGKFIYKRFEKINEMYEALLKEFIEIADKTEDKLIVFKYKEDKTSFTSDLSNEAIYKYQDKVVMIAREKNGEMKCSLRSAKINLPEIVDKALAGLKGYGGGHEHACGLNVGIDDFDELVKRIKKMI